MDTPERKRRNKTSQSSGSSKSGSKGQMRLPNGTFMSPHGENKNGSNRDRSSEQENAVAKSGTSMSSRSQTSHKHDPSTMRSSGDETKFKTKRLDRENEGVLREDTNAQTTDLNDANQSPSRVSVIELDVIKKSIPAAIKLPSFLPTKNIHENWVFSRVFSEEIYSTFDKHMKKFEGDYLSRYLLGEIFHEKVNEEDTDFDPSIFFQAVEVTKVKKLFACGFERKRLVIDCREIPTSNNINSSDEDKARKIVAEGSLAELLAHSSKEGDFLIIFGDIMLEKSKLVTLNSRYQHPVAIALYRHDGIFRPSSEDTKEFEDLVRPFKNPKLVHTLFETTATEVLIKVQPNVPETDTDILMVQPSSQSQDTSLNSIVPELKRRILNTTPTPVSSPKRRKLPSLPSTPVDKIYKKRDTSVQIDDGLSDDDDLQIDLVKEIQESRILDSSNNSSSSVESSAVPVGAKGKNLKNIQNGKGIRCKEMVVNQNRKEKTEHESSQAKVKADTPNKSLNGSIDLFENIDSETQYFSLSQEAPEIPQVQNSTPVPKIKDCSVRLEPLHVAEEKYKKQLTNSVSASPKSVLKLTPSEKRTGSAPKSNRNPKEKKNGLHRKN